MSIERRGDFMQVDTKTSYEQAMEIAKRVAKRIRAELDSQAEIYLFGSVVSANNNSESDIDIAVVSKLFTNDVCANYARVNFLASGVDDNIDAQAVIYDDWINKTPFTAEVKRHGVLIG